MPIELTHDSTARELTTDQGVLRYHEAGEGPPLLLLHGSGPGVTGWRNFRGNLPVLAEHFRCLILEFPGFGVSHPTDEHPMAAAVKAVPRFFDGLGLQLSFAMSMGPPAEGCCQGDGTTPVAS